MITEKQKTLRIIECELRKYNNFILTSGDTSFILKVIDKLITK